MPLNRSMERFGKAVRTSRAASQETCLSPELTWALTATGPNAQNDTGVV